MAACVYELVPGVFSVGELNAEKSNESWEFYLQVPGAPIVATKEEAQEWLDNYNKPQCVRDDDGA